MGTAKLIEEKTQSVVEKTTYHLDPACKERAGLQ